jgi:hypothetical protein
MKTVLLKNDQGVKDWQDFFLDFHEVWEHSEKEM